MLLIGVLLKIIKIIVFLKKVTNKVPLKIIILYVFQLFFFYFCLVIHFKIVRKLCAFCKMEIPILTNQLAPIQSFHYLLLSIILWETFKNIFNKCKYPNQILSAIPIYIIDIELCAYVWYQITTKCRYTDLHFCLGIVYFYSRICKRY